MTLPKKTASTAAGSTLPAANAAFEEATASSVALRLLSFPPKVPKGVLQQQSASSSSSSSCRPKNEKIAKIKPRKSPTQEYKYASRHLPLGCDDEEVFGRGGHYFLGFLCVLRLKSIFSPKRQK